MFAWFGHAFLNYDTFYALVWGSDLAHLRTPEYSVPVAPTPHPLAELVGIVLTPFGASAEDLMLALGLLGLGMLAVGLFRLGQELFGTWVGVLAALIVLTRVPILNFGIRGYVDLPTAAFVVWAAVLEARRPRRGAAVLVLLALAGLLRPEAWLYAGAYWLWLRAPLRLLPLALAAIVVFFPLQQVDRLNALKHDIANRARIQSDLHSLVEQPAAKTALARCPRVYVESHRPVPLLALWAGRHPADILVGRHATCAVLPASPEVAKLAILDSNEPVAPGSIATPRARALARNRSWVLIGP